jgi:hypothetical protein
MHWLAFLVSQCGKDKMIEITKSETADTRTCAFATVTEETLKKSSETHIDDVSRGMAFFGALLAEAAVTHDSDKISAMAHFHSDFVTGFKTTGWWDNHRKITRHHLQVADGVPADVNLIDVLEMIVDCVMAGMARSGSVYAVEIPPDVLKRAFDNTVELLKGQVVVKANVPVSGGTPSDRVAGSPHYSAVCPKCNKTTAWLDPRHEAEDVLCIHCGNLLEGTNS